MIALSLPTDQNSILVLPNTGIQFNTLDGDHFQTLTQKVGSDASQVNSLFYKYSEDKGERIHTIPITLEVQCKVLDGHLIALNSELDKKEFEDRIRHSAKILNSMNKLILQLDECNTDKCNIEKMLQIYVQRFIRIGARSNHSEI